jgi:NFU1 iron-sulfur cluster scaffold homolog, mitochondrial
MPEQCTCYNSRMDSDIKILAEVSREDPATCKFTVDRVILAGGCARFDNSEASSGSPLAQKLFAVPGVSGVDLYGKTIVIRKTGIENWRTIGPQIGAAIREHIRSGQPGVTPEAMQNRPAEAKLRSEIDRVLRQQINPAVASHGGAISLLDVHGTTVFIQMSGGCQGCASASVTLREGVERTLREQVPGVQAIVDVSDHAAGTNPYYAHATR